MFLIFANFENGCHFDVVTIFFLYVILKVEYAMNITRSISDILSFDRCSSWNIARAMVV